MEISFFDNLVYAVSLIQRKTVADLNPGAILQEIHVPHFQPFHLKAKPLLQVCNQF